jgi:hypothetical protein
MKPINEFLKDIQQMEITWVETKNDPAMFEAVFAGEHVKLRLNDFPDEPICTLFIRDKGIDIEEHPRIWHLQHE